MDVAAMTLDAELDEWLALLRTRIQPTTFRGYDDMINAYLRQALKEAVRDDLLDDNVAARVRLPRLDPERDPEPHDLQTWDATQAARFLALTADDPLHAIRRVALATGMRRRRGARRNTACRGRHEGVVHTSSER